MRSSTAGRLVTLVLALGGLVAATLDPVARTAHAAAVTAREPAFGLPHIFADTDLELARENGRQIARDRFGQLILLARVGRGTLYQAFGVLDATTLADDIEARRTAYTSSELNNMWAKLPQRERDIVMEYCKGVNDTIDAVYAGSSPEPMEVNLLRNVLGLGFDLFGNATNVSDQVDPNFAPPGGAWPNAGFQFTPEMAIAIGILEVRNFGLGGFDEATRFSELQKLIGVHGASLGTELWSDLNYANDPLASATVPDPTLPGYGGPLALRDTPVKLAGEAARYPRYDYARAMAQVREAAAHRAEVASALGAWPKLGSYAWGIAGGRSATGYPWIGGFPQTGIQTPSIMHFAENRSAEGTDHRIEGFGMEFAGAPFILIGHTDTVAYTTTTAQLPVIDTFFEEVVVETTDALRYSDEGTPTAMLKRTEIFLGGLAANASRVFWRTHERNGNKGSRAVFDFLGDRDCGSQDNECTVDSAGASSLVDAGAFNVGFVGGFVAIVDGPGAGQMREILAVPNANTLTLTTTWTTTPTTASRYVAVRPGNPILAAALDSAAWQEESTTVVGFAHYQRAETIGDIRAGARLMPTTHNFLAGDNQTFNGTGTSSGSGNIGYWSSGYSRVRQGGQDPRLPLDGTGPNPLVLVGGSVVSAGANTLSAASGAFTGNTFTPPPLNYRYDNPTLLPSEYVVVIMSGTGAKQSRRIASNDNTTLTIEEDWGVIPAPGDTFEVYEIIAMPEAINPSEGYMANWNNKAATTDPGDDFSREHRVSYILERLAADTTWTRDEQRQLNKDIAGAESRGKLGRFLIPRLRQAVDRVGNGGNAAVDTVLAALEAHNGAPDFGRFFIDPVFATTRAGEVTFLSSLINRLSLDIYGDEYAGAFGAPGGSRAFSIIQHAIDSKEGDLPGAYAQAYSGDYFNAAGAVDNFTCYGAKTTKNTPRFATVKGVPLADQFETKPFNVKKPELLCAPGNLDGGGVTDAVTHLVAHKIGGAPTKHTPQLGVIVETTYGTLSVDTIKPDRLLVPSGKNLSGSASLPTGTLDHFKCYQVRVTPNTPKLPEGIQATVADQFESRLYNVIAPKRLCVPVDKDGEGIQNPVSHLLCYRIKLATGEPAHVPVVNQIHTMSQFGESRLDTTRQKELCVPALKNGADALQGWEVTVRNSLSTQATIGIPADSARPNSTYSHPLSAVDPVDLTFEPTPSGNRGTYEQIIDVGPVVNGEFMFPLGQSGLIQGGVGGVTSIDPNFTSLQPIWRDWRFVPILHVSQDLAGAGADSDGDGVFDGYERWYYGALTNNGASDTDGDGLSLLGEFTAGSDPTDSDTDDDGALDGSDSKPQDREIT